MTKILHNPRCGKSRQALALLNEKNESPEIIEYLKTPISKAELEDILKMLDIAPLALIRKGEKIFKEQFKGKELTDNEWIDIMIDNPILIERPIVIKNGKAVVARPPEDLLGII